MNLLFKLEIEPGTSNFLGYMTYQFDHRVEIFIAIISNLQVIYWTIKIIM